MSTKIATVGLFQISVSYVFAKYDANWFTVRKVIAKIKGVNFFETQCTVVNVSQSGIRVRRNIFAVVLEDCHLCSSRTHVNILF